MSSRKYKQYPAKFRESSAKLALEIDQPMSQTARELGVTPKSLYSGLAHILEAMVKLSLQKSTHLKKLRV